MNTNLSWQFYKGYWPEDPTGDENALHFKNQNDIFFDFKFEHILLKKESKTTFSHQFQLKTTYPGLTIGMGYAHSIKQIGEFKIGFYFDHTSGLPVIPGSSVKGVLNAFFEEKENIEQLLNRQFSDSVFGELKKEIFDGTFNGQLKSPYKRDIFFDAELVETENSGGLILGSDTLAPHENQLKDPNPLLFLKVLPGVVFDFRFQLHDSDLKSENGQTILSKEEKQDVFLKILLKSGVGAKTNVGYGRLKPKNELNSAKLQAFEKQLDDFLKTPSSSVSAQKPRQMLILKKLKPGKDVLIGKFVEKIGKMAHFTPLNVEEFDGSICVSTSVEFEIDKKYELLYGQFLPKTNQITASLKSIKPID
jgi:CRISPR-associated protein Cmr6